MHVIGSIFVAWMLFCLSCSQSSAEAEDLKRQGAGGSGGDAAATEGERGTRNSGAGSSGGNRVTTTGRSQGEASGGVLGIQTIKSPCRTVAGMSQNPPQAFLHVGHASIIRNLTVSGDRVLSQSKGRWILWDTSIRLQLAGGQASGADPYQPMPGLEMRADRVLVPTVAGLEFELRSAVDGSLVATISTAYNKLGLAVDGSYVWGEANGGITFWDSMGMELFVSPVAYVGSVYAAPDALHIANGPAGSNVIQVVPIDGSPPTSTLFNGTFHSWFQDSARFLTTTGTTVRVYSENGVQEDIVNLPLVLGLAGTHNYIWIHNLYSGQLSIYKIGAGNVPVASYDFPSYSIATPTERAIAVVSDEPTVDVIDVGGAFVTRVQTTVPSAENWVAHVDSGLRWAVGNERGVIFQKGTVADPQSKGTLGCGQPISLYGVPSGDVAIATTSGRILVYHPADPGAGPKASVPFNSSHVQLAGDGSLLAARSTTYAGMYLDDNSLRFFAIPQATELSVIQQGMFPPLWDFSMSLSGKTLGRSYSSFGYSTEKRYANHLADGKLGKPMFQDMNHLPTPMMSPNGSRFIVSDNDPSDVEAIGCGYTQFYQGQMIINAVAGCALGWIDDDRVLVQAYKYDANTHKWIYEASIIYDEQGGFLGYTPLPKIRLPQPPQSTGWGYGFQTVSPTSIYARWENTIYDLNNGAALATFPANHGGTVAGGFIVYPCADGVCADTAL